MLGLTSAAGARRPACLPSALFPLGKPSQRHREQCRAYLIVYLRNITQVADRRCGWKITGTMEPWRARKRFCTSIMLSNKITNQSLVNRGCFFFSSPPSTSNCSFRRFDAALEIFRFGAKMGQNGRRSGSDPSAQRGCRSGTAPVTETIRKPPPLPLPTQHDGSL